MRIIRELDATTGKPTWCIFENVLGLISMGLDTVLSDLENEAYAAWPFVVPACAVNAPHRRDRVWIVANANGARLEELHISAKPNRQRHCTGGDNENDAADTNTKYGDISGLRASQVSQQQEASLQRDTFADPQGQQTGGVFEPWFSPNLESGGDWRGQAGEWITEPGICERDDGIPDRVARLKALGNAVVPQIPELIGKIIMKIENK